MLLLRVSYSGTWRSVINSTRHCQGWRLYSTIQGESRKLPLTVIDQKWQSFWKSTKLGKLRHQRQDGESTSPLVYVLPMFPYPSGNLHMGHVRVYTISDVVARYNYMRGRDVLHPIGWDAFGLPAENAAIERELDPAVWTTQNISQMRNQLVAMNGLWDWERELVTCDPSYYKHNQALFLKLLEHGLAYQQEAVVNWDPVDCTVLANEQVDDNGNSWRSGAKVEQRLLKQWFLKITHFAEELHAALDKLRTPPFQWPENVLLMQRNWLRKSEGHQISFDIHVDSSQHLDVRQVSVFTTRLDTIFGVQYVALATDHIIVQQMSKHDPDLQVFLQGCKDGSLSSETGYRLKGVEATNPLGQLGLRTPSLPVYVAQYVVPGYGTGSVMGVPAHDQRDSNFWRANGTGSPPRVVVTPDRDPSNKTRAEVYIHKGYLNSACDKYEGLHSDTVIEQLREHLGLDQTVMWGLRDWLISRQRYWGTPIPVIHCDTCGAVPVPENQLPVRLPTLPHGTFKGRGGNPLDHDEQWVNTTCPKCHKPAKRETDTMDTFMDSSWYFFRFTDPHNSEHLFDKAKSQQVMPVNYYIGGVEHAILHLLYARFITKFIASAGLWDPAGIAEPFQKLITQGMVHGKTFSDPVTGRFLRPDEVNLVDPASPKIVGGNVSPNVTFEKMSKSKYNGVDPQSCINKYGADATRAHVLFQANEREVLEWNEQPIVGIIRSSLSSQGILAFRAIQDGRSTSFPKDKYTEPERVLLQATKTAIRHVTQKLEEVSGLNTVVSDLLKLANALDIASKKLPSSMRAADEIVSSAVFYHCTSVLIRIMAPIVPAWAEEGWHALKGYPSGEKSAPPDAKSVLEEPWPTENDVAVTSAHSKTENVVIMINGRKFGNLVIPSPPDTFSAEEKSHKHLNSQPLGKWYLEQVLERSEKGQQLLNKYGDFSKMEKRIVRLGGNQNGILINLVSEKNKKKKSSL